MTKNKFICEIEEPRKFRDSVSTIGQLIDEGIFRITPDGLNFQAPDRAMVTVVNMMVSEEFFDKFEEDGELEIPLNITEFVSVLKRLSSGDRLRMELSGNKLVVKMIGNIERTFTLPLLKLNQEETPPVNDLSFDCEVKMFTSVLSDAISDADIISDVLQITSDGENLVLKSIGEISSSELVIGKDSELLQELNVKKKSKSKYPLEYLKKIIKTEKIFSNFGMFWSEDYPMRLRFENDEGIVMEFIVAPRVTED